jgi:putative membrane protein
MTDKRPSSETEAEISPQIARHSASVKASAKNIEKSAIATERSADVATTLAADRTVLAAERTYAAWIRTGLAALASGVGANALLTGLLPAWFIRLTGSLLIVFSAFCFVASVWRELIQGLPPPLPNIRRLPIALLFCVNGMLIVVALAALAGIWIADR